MTAASQPRPIACSASPVASSGRPPMRSDSEPAMGATRIGMAVQGSVRSPACSGE
jgi:hypothetical protein